MHQLRSYAVVTGAYWSFMLTDGALRMLVLLYFHELGYAPTTLAFLFLFYEFFGIVTNLFGGWGAQRFGLKATLIWGLALQPIALIGLTFMNPEWAPIIAVPFVMGIQALSGISKDLTKMSSKSAVKLLVKSDDQSGLFKLVAILTGSKNAIKGIGFFLGGLLLSTLGFNIALYALASLLILTLILSLAFVRGDYGKMKQKVKFTQLFSKSQAINRLSFARALLFASRDVWFVVGLPIFLHQTLGWSFSQVGAFMAAWIIGYGFIQAIAPRFTGINKQSSPSNNSLKTIINSLRTWAALLVIICAGIYTCLHFEIATTYTLTIGLFIFGFIFAINSSIHSYLILAYTKTEEVALNVGFYYMANACGRLAGTLLSGLAYYYAGLPACLLCATVLTLAAAVINMRLPPRV